MHVEDRGAHGAKKLVAHITEDVMVLIEAGRVKEHHLHEAVGIVGKLLQAQRLAQAKHGIERAFEEALGAFFLLGGAVGKALVDEALGKVHAAEHVLVQTGTM